jgi:hypothetical protein
MLEILTMLAGCNVFIFVPWWNIDPIVGISVRKCEIVICS